MRYFNFLFHPAGDRPALELSPHHTRMAGCYPDKKGFYHVSVDFIILRGTAIDRGGYDYAADTGDPDCYGAGSPDVILADGKIYVFYPGRGPLPHGSKMNGLAKRGEKSLVSADIMCAYSPVDSDGAPFCLSGKRGLL
jgi:hypothetical protein